MASASLQHSLYFYTPLSPRHRPCGNPSQQLPTPLVLPTSPRPLPRVSISSEGVVCLPRRVAFMTGSGAGEYSDLLLGRDEKESRKVAGIDQERLLDPELLADPDSLFYSFNGVMLHHKLCEGGHGVDNSTTHESCEQLPRSGTAKITFPMILLHGFGASVFSWSRVMKYLARVSESKVLAFDRPAFGLTSRIKYPGTFSSRNEDVKPLNPYSIAFSVLATLSFCDMLDADKVVLMGHSAGCLVAVDTYFEAPERVAALILVAPAIVAPFIQRRVSQEKQSKTVGNSNDQENPTFWIWKSLCRICMSVACLVLRLMKLVKDMVYSVYRKVMSVILRSTVAMMLVRIVVDKFGILGIRNSWFDASLVTDRVIHGYTKPLRARGWEMALLEHTLSMLTDSSSESKIPLSKRLSEIACPVLIVTGDSDRLVPSWNAVRLSSAMPGSTLEVIQKCGHIPHEEKPEEFLLVVEKFLGSLPASSQTSTNVV